MKFNQENFKQVYPDAVELMIAHHEEVTIFDGHKLDIDSEGYAQADEVGTLKVFSVREDGKLVGYASFFLYLHTHHKKTVHAAQDTVYLAPTHRGIGLEFSQYCDNELKSMGVRFVHRGLPLGSKFGQRLESLGYQEKERIFIKELK